MAHIKVKTDIEIADNNGVKKIIPLRYSLTTVNEIVHQEIDISADATSIIWDPTNWTGYQMTDFDLIIMFSDKTLDIELTINEGDSNEELNSFRLVPDIPFILGADDAYYNHSASDIFAGSLDVIDKIRVDEPNSTAAKLNLILVS